MFPFHQSSKQRGSTAKTKEPQVNPADIKMPIEQMNTDPEPPDPKNAAATTSKQVQTGIERYITITEKRKRSPLANNLERPAKVPKDIEKGRNYYEILDIAEKPKDADPTSTEVNYKPPPIYIRQSSSSDLIKAIKKLIGEQNFYIVDLRRGNIKETKVQPAKEVHYTQVVNWLDSQKLNYYTYQLKSAKGLRVVIKGIDSNVDPAEIIEDLKAQGFEVKTAYNIINKNQVPQPMFKIELTPEASKAPKGKPHPIYNIRYVLNRKITVEEPYKKTTIVQCTNCQEYGHTKNYCKLTNVCVACGELHQTRNCNKDKEDPETKKCSNCSGNHTANYRGCPVYTAINKRGPQARHQTRAYVHTQATTTSPPIIPQIPQQVPVLQERQTTGNLTYAEATKINNLPPSNNGLHDQILQILLSLTSNIQQLSNTMNQMQCMLSKQTEILAKLLKP